MTSPSPAVPTFAELGLPAVLVQALRRAGFDSPFPIQTAAIPDVLAGRDVLGRGPTGSGKTLAFGLPMLVRLSGSPAKPGRPRGLVLAPTRELAAQIERALEEPALALGLRVASVVGGAPIGRQSARLARGVDLLVATPGRLADLINQGAANLSDVAVTTLDEADHMADLGFLPQVTKLLDKTPKNGQRLLFSATLDRGVDKLVQRYLTDPVTHSTAPAEAAVSTMSHHLLVTTKADKRQVLAEIASREGLTILFVRTKHGADRLAKQLRASGVAAGALHGGKAQNNRVRTLAAFADGSVPVLVTTDLAARGIHVDGISLVVHADPPIEHKAYLHRAGRTARAGEVGVVVTIAMEEERSDTIAMTRKAGLDLKPTPVRPGDATLIRITDARTPSGIPLPTPGVPAQQQVSADDATRAPRRRNRGGGGGGGARQGEAARGQRSGAPRRERAAGGEQAARPSTGGARQGQRSAGAQAEPGTRSGGSRTAGARTHAGGSRGGDTRTTPRTGDHGGGRRRASRSVGAP
ncbi:DEAD/DEAH box helicase [Nocardia asteroides]|uniref:DEAD/DEAH box helicase n=1 Tax=Nocardia asteroides TaxID=1824 RepID=UPI001E3FF47D|nr:DEAD/DEAH box helicase [Nocardia asteroides]UGT63162.1 DEAD/DEAH box helicase [Nocardia asteroides]